MDSLKEKMFSVIEQMAAEGLNKSKIDLMAQAIRVSGVGEPNEINQRLAQLTGNAASVQQAVTPGKTYTAVNLTAADFTKKKDRPESAPVAAKAKASEAIEEAELVVDIGKAKDSADDMNFKTMATDQVIDYFGDKKSMREYLKEKGFDAPPQWNAMKLALRIQEEN